MRVVNGPALAKTRLERGTQMVYFRGIEKPVGKLLEGSLTVALDKLDLHRIGYEYSV